MTGDELGPMPFEPPDVLPVVDDAHELDDARGRLRELATLADTFEAFARQAARSSKRPGDYDAGRSCTFELAAVEIRRALTRPPRPLADDGEE